MQQNPQGHYQSPQNPQQTSQPYYSPTQGPQQASPYAGGIPPSSLTNPYSWSLAAAYGSPPTSPTAPPNAFTSAPPPQPQRRRSSFRSIVGNVIREAFSPVPTYANSMPQQAPTYAPNPTPAASVIIVNRVALDPTSLSLLQRHALVPVQPGRYWYDARSGAWGLDGGPCLGAIAPRLTLGGPLPADASGPSTTGVFINGRQIHATDALQLQMMGITPIPGRWWVEADGRYGLEGMPIAMGNLIVQGMAAGGGGGGQSWSTSGGSFGGTDGSGFGYVGGTDSTGRMWSVSYGS